MNRLGGLPFGGGAVTEVLHDLLCSLALSTVRHDLPFKKKKKMLGDAATIITADKLANVLA